MKKKLILALVGAMMFASAFADTEVVDGVTWTYSVSGGQATIGGSGHAVHQGTVGPIVIPSTLGGCPVTAIADDAFYGCAQVTSVTLPPELTTIGRLAFCGCGVPSMTIPSGVTSIHHQAFVGCGRLTEFSVDSDNPNYSSPGGLLCDKAGTTLVNFPGGRTGEVEIPSTITSIGSCAFESSSLTSVKIPAGVVSIGDLAFGECFSLAEFVVADGSDSFSVRNGLLCDKEGKKVVCCPGARVGEVVIPSGVTCIGGHSFANCQRVTAVRMPDTVSELEWLVFNGCSSLTSLVLPESVTKIGMQGLSFCSVLSSVFFKGDAPEGLKSLYSYSPNATTYVRKGSKGWSGEAESTEIPGSWPVGDSYPRPIVALEGSRTVSFDLGAHGARTGGGSLEQEVDVIGAAIAPEVCAEDGWEFCGWDAEFDCVISNQLIHAQYKGGGAFEDGDYEAMTNGYTWAFFVVNGEATIKLCAEKPVGHVVIPGELGGCPVVALGVSLFDAECREDVSGLTGVTIPASVTSIRNWAFLGCSSLKHVIFEGDSSSIEFGYDVFAGTPYENGWPVPFLHMDGTVLTGIDWQIMHEDCGCVTNGVIEIPEGTTAIAARACESLAMEKSFLKEPLSVKIPQSVMSIGDYAFAWLENLYDVSLDSTNGVSATAFNGTPWKLKTYGWKLPFFSSEPPDGGTPAVGTTYVRYETVSEDVPCAVSDKTVTIDGSSLAANAFSEHCDKKIKAVNLSPNVKSIGSCAFSACPYLYQVTLGSTTTAIASDAFGDDVEVIDNLSFALNGSIGLLGGWKVVSGGSVLAPSQETYPVAGNLPFKLGAGYLVSPITKTLKVAPGFTSEFEIPDCCSPVRAVIAGVEGAEWTDFTDCEYMGSNRESGEVPFCRCLTYADIVDVEKTAAADADDNACYYLPQVNMAYWGGWIPKSAFATEDDVADYFRNQPDGFDSIFDWVDQNSAAFGCTESIWDAVSYPDYTNRTAAAFNRFIVENLKDGNALVMLGTVFSGHGITCCGYAVDSAKTIADGGYLKGLFIVDSDNDVYVNGGGRNAPNRITYCALEWVADPSDEDSGNYMIADIWGYSWDYVFCESALRAMKAAPAKPDGTYEEVVDGVKFNFTVIGGKASLGGGSNKATVVPTSTRGTVKVPATLGGCPVTALGRSAFDDCAGVTEVILPNGLQEVGSMAFRGCASLQQAFLPTSVTSVGTGAFTGCTALEELTLPNGLASIGNYAFSYCGSVTAVTVPATVTSIGYMAFEGCTGIETVRFNGNVPSGLARSCLLDTATRVFYPRAYESAYAAIVPAEKFAGYSDTKGLMLMKAASAGRPVLVDDAWANETLDSRFGKGKVAEFKEKFGRDFAAALFKTTGKVGADGHAMTVLDDFISGTDPTDADSKLQAKIEIGADGKPKVTWTPDLNEGTTKDERTYRVMGAKNLGDGWTEVPSGNEADFNFFKVEVSMPNN